MSGHIAWPKLRYPLVAILRGIRPEETEAIVSALIETGFEAIEIPLNSPAPFTSIEKAAKLAPKNVLIGAGTVLSVDDVDRLNDVGGRLLVSPNVEPEVIRRAGSHGMVTMPGVFTPTEAFSAIRAGASALKFFPASVLGAEGIKAVCAVLPKDIPVGAVGGISQNDFATYAAAGVTCFGLGSSLYKAGFSAADVQERAQQAVAAWDKIAG
ncbi:2-dehydro-3-deoxyphosphogluconate aldolase/4-hydroxy-2-oxoglutarate aldolase [Brucella abortus F6/05-3]|uniref:2-dehydro-3-deoxy-6-phosphogalactonate aldolase n=1 Tax=Brucella abortus TaxID=235 RepID=UPI0001B4948B|nr:2-dehydro-3-deoxy-6-phosphogalactonate aldolase [Brucella abortus]AIJ56396.1 dihydroorotate dehydrogenase family protein [Brucella abortus]AIJ76027.1 dihydroorotate dehydrogenase family protein [Brucella abortus]EEX84850.1 KDPG and KHG aldolase [Brucella abortus bv. 3 str. Tulya]ENP34327.1 2-dehydro-3-deoxyphosphogluconate aldolase/4-hydroxy-2-oxoglutarate aldolase [Brucella abortus 65/110]ENP40260.1 2-dehydro-3-deoxyphosphogluconate aldolase/4-hydroxy-2-oxoglutarate aldolase [Brucella abor